MSIIHIQSTTQPGQKSPIKQQCYSMEDPVNDHYDWRLKSIFARIFSKHRQKYNSKIPPKCPTLEVAHIVFNTLLHLPQLIRFTSVSTYLCPAGNARFYIMPNPVIIDQFRILVCMFQHMWPRANNGHLTNKYIKELGKLVQI